MAHSSISVIKSAVQPLSDRFSLTAVQETTAWPVESVLFVNATTALEVLVDWSELRAFLKVAARNALAEPAGTQRPDQALPSPAYDVDDLLILRATPQSPVGKLLPAPEVAPLRALLDEYSAALEHSAGDVLRGDFKVFDELARVVAERRNRFSGA